MQTKTRTEKANQIEKLKRALDREHISLNEARRLLVPVDPWEAARGLLKDRGVAATREQRRIRKEWDRS